MNRGVNEVPPVIVDTKVEPVAVGSFQPSWDSLKQYRMPEWFRDAKFGIWAHWGAQCEAEDGDWYARAMYQEGNGKYKSHLEHYGHPSTNGFKDVIHQWKAEKWDPDRLVALYKRAGAHYFFAMANHHDNFDNWDSKHQPWNAAAIGPKKDLMAGWARAAKSQGLPFGVSVHAAHAWSWYEPAQGADREGPMKGVPYDGNLTRADGKGQWWEGLDPQDLYAQNHPPSRDFTKPASINSQWDWSHGCSVPSQAYCQNFYDRTVDLINHCHPDLIYFDDTVLPLWPVSDAGLKIAAHMYNSNPRAVLFGKILNEEQRKAITWDIERGVPSTLLPFAWQTDTCIGNWHYDRGLYERNGYKSATTVIHMLADIVSKNGNLLLNIPVRGDGSIDEKEEAVLEGIAAWMKVNSEAIFNTRPWVVFGEGPASEGAALSAQGFNEGKSKPFTAQDVRFTQGKDGKTLYAIVLGRMEKDVSIASLGREAKHLERDIADIRLLESTDTVKWIRTDKALVIEPPKTPVNLDHTVVFRLSLK